MRIKDVESLVGITKKNIRFYEKEGLLSPGRETENGYRDYNEEDVRRLKVIKLLRGIDMPISEISNVIEGRIELHEAMHLHSLFLEERRSNIAKCQRICSLISADRVGLDELDTEKYLRDMERMSAEAPVLRDVKHKDRVHKYRETVVVSLLIVSMLILLTGFAVHMLRAGGEAPMELIIVFMVGVVAVAVGTVIAFVSRFKELKEENEDDISKY